MNQSLSKHDLAQILSQGCLYILNDADGCVMLTTDDEDGVPIWSEQSLAEAWADQDWSHCEVKSITLKQWQERWLPGLTSDGLLVVLNPSLEAEEGEFVSAQTFTTALINQK